ncbi:MAG: hypothetical protein IKC20_02655 [Clostridia bacterium]|nr:hypothetical protein [Clostridia bacterium]
MKKRLIAIILSVAMIFSATSLPVLAADEFTASEITLNTLGEKVLQGLVGIIAGLIKAPNKWLSEDKYFETTELYDTKTEFVDDAQAEYWSLGYASDTLQTGNELECYVGGSLAVTKKLATEVYDDQRVRTVAISDGRGTHVFVALDCFGFASSEVYKVRDMLSSFAKENNVVSINISSLHQHSCVDTFGMNGDLVGALFLSPIRNILGIPNPSGQNEAFMNNLYATVIGTVETAVKNMTEGDLYYGSVDISEYIHDKRDPQVIDPNLNRFRFVPADGSTETWIVNLAIHTVGLGAGGTSVSADYPYYMEKYINENAKANFMMIQGAELAITSEYGENLVVDPAIVEKVDEGYARMAAYGAKLGEFACSVQDSKKIDPILNYATSTYLIPTENQILILAGKGGLLTNTVVKTGLWKYSVVSEVGYMELGKDIAVVIAGGELAPEIAYGGATTKEDSWSGEEWNFEPIKDNVDGRTLIVFGITNDQTGYMLTDNSWRSFLCENEEIVTPGPKAGSAFATAFYGLLDSVR